MKILVIPSWYPPKGGFFFQEQSEALARLGHEVVVAVTNEYSLKEFDFSSQNSFERNGVKVYENKFWRIPKLNNWNESRYVSASKAFVRKIAKEFKPDVIHAHSALWAGYAASELEIPLVITEHRSRFIGNTEAKKLIQKKHVAPMKQAFDAAKAIIPVSNAIGEGIKTLFDNQTRQVTIPNMINTDDFRFSPYPKNDVFQFISIGNFETYKGMDLLINAVKELVNSGVRNFKLTIIGEGSMKKELEASIQGSEYASHLQFMETVSRDDVIRLISESNAFVSTSRYEAFGVAMVEALCIGRPVIATKSGGPMDFINDSNGCLCAIDSKAIAESMSTFITSEQKFDYQQISSESIRNFDSETIAKRIEAVLKESCHD